MIIPLDKAVKFYEKVGNGFNANEFVYVTLTKEGRKILTDHNKKFSDSYARAGAPIPTDQARFQLWDLMNIFGAHMGLVKMSPFENNEIRFIDATPDKVVAIGEEGK